MLRAHAGQLLGVEEGARGWRWAVPCRVPAACGKSTCSCGGGAGHWHLGFNQAGSSGEQWQGAHLAQRQPPLLEVPACRGQGMHQLVAVPGHGMVPGHRRGEQWAQLHPAGHRGAGRGSAARSCLGFMQQPAWAGEAQGSRGSVPGLGPLQLPRPLAGAFGAGALGFVPGAACARMLLRPEPAVSRQAGDPRLQEVFAGLGPEQSVQIEVGGELMETGEQLPWSSKAGR